ncbi:MAG TPA: PqqD family protein, partial [Candidatus Omnitrophota bacterium]|nr:PqqD family protein [Candidatus Omnitrophota bacterium]
MENEINLEAKYVPSEDVVARDVQGEFIIIPIASGIADSEDELFSLNDTGRAVWNNLDGRRSLKEVAGSLASEFEAPAEEIE